jgi:hypothetical protein
VLLLTQERKSAFFDDTTVSFQNKKAAPAHHRDGPHRVFSKSRIPQPPKDNSDASPACTRTETRLTPLLTECMAGIIVKILF